MQKYIHIYIRYIYIYIHINQIPSSIIRNRIPSLRVLDWYWNFPGDYRRVSPGTPLQILQRSGVQTSGIDVSRHHGSPQFINCIYTYIYTYKINIHIYTIYIYSIYTRCIFQKELTQTREQQCHFEHMFLIPISCKMSKLINELMPFWQRRKNPSLVSCIQFDCLSDVPRY